MRTLWLRQPGSDILGQFLAEQSTLDFTYPAVGATAETPPAGFWWLNSCRIVYTVEEFGDTNRFGFAFGTLPGHVESWEERFLIEWNRSTDQVVYDILAFSKPNHILTRLGYPLVRLCQKRFGRDSAASMFHAVNADASLPAVVQTTNPTC